jgi:hypothetical protein
LGCILEIPLICQKGGHSRPDSCSASWHFLPTPPSAGFSHWLISADQFMLRPNASVRLSAMLCSAMTSAGCTNPSLTYMALTARAVDHAVSEMKKGNL